MSKFGKYMIIAAAFLAIGAIAWITDPEEPGMLPGILIGTGAAALVQAALFAFNKKKKRTTTRVSIPRAPENQLPSVAENYVAEEAAAVQASALSSDHRRKQWQKTETVVDQMLDGFIASIAAKLPYHTIAVFFPSQDDTFMLRRHMSRGTYVNKNAQILPRRGLLGSIIADRDKLRPHFYEPNFTNKNTTLYYYNDDYEFKPEENVRSIMLSPIEAAGDIRGLLLVDNTIPSSYSTGDQDFIADIAKLLGQSIYYTYLNTEHSLDYQRLIAISNTEKDFWRNLEFDAVMDKMRDIIPYAIPCCDRLTISLKDEEKQTAVIWRAFGLESEGLEKLQYQIGDNNPRAIAGMAIFKEFGFFRNLHEDNYEYRFKEDEPRSNAFASFLAVPFGAGNGLILVESTQRDVFTNTNVELLSRIGTSAGLALEKIFIIRKADALAVRDGLTNLYNHRQFQKILATKLATYSRYKEPISLTLCDIDYFKKLNDKYGHPFGDVVLKGVAAKLEGSIRIEIDAAARYGGEEFVLILDKTDTLTAKDTVERIRQSIEDMTFRTTDGKEVKATMSFGIATYPEHARDLNELIAKADKALYRAKKNGRNRVEVY